MSKDSFLSACLSGLQMQHQIKCATLMLAYGTGTECLTDGNRLSLFFLEKESEWEDNGTKCEANV